MSQKMLRTLALAAVGFPIVSPAYAQNTIKVGVNAEFSGPLAD
jgi:hypothetical protein